MEASAKDFVTRNTHPASISLQQCSGVTFHPGHQNKGITDNKSPYAFENIGLTLAFKYFEAKQHNRLGDFFDQAFVAQQPCDEAVAENLMNFDASSRVADVIFHPRPQWNPTLTESENASGMLAWVARKMFADYARSNAIDLGNLTLKVANELEASSEFFTYLINNEHRVNEAMRNLVEKRVGASELRRIVHDDLVMGLSVAMGHAFALGAVARFDTGI